MTFDFGESPLQIICADDLESCRELLSGQLTRLGHNAVFVSDGDEALSAIIADLKKFDVLIADNDMGRTCGLDLIKKAKVAGFKGMIIVLSGYLDDDLRGAYEALRVHAILSKPCPETKLQEVLQS